jgi:CubicO group peptidase (beta-lactamase class C family)
MQRIYIILFLFCMHTAGYSQQKQIDAEFQTYAQTNNFSGNVLIKKGDQTIFSRSYGFMNAVYHLKNTRETKFYLASVSMIFTSAAVMKLAEENKLSLNDPLSKLLPDYKYGDKITLHHLMSQRSGIKNVGADAARYDSISKFTHSIQQLFPYFIHDSLNFAPNTDYAHARSDYILLAYVIEKVSGMSFGDYLKKNLFDPLQMNNTGHSQGERYIVKNAAVGYSPAGEFDIENATQIDWTSKTGHGSIYSTVDDLMKFADAIMNNRLLTRSSWEKIFTDYGNNVGYGWFIRDHAGKKRYQMNGRSPGFSSYFAIYPDEKLIVIVLSNINITIPSVLGTQSALIVFNQPYTPTNFERRIPDASFLQKATGTYRFPNKFYRPDFEMHVSLKNGMLLTDWGVLSPFSTNKQQSNKFTLRNYWSDVEFLLNEKGEIDTMMLDGYKGVRIK